MLSICNMIIRTQNLSDWTKLILTIFDSLRTVSRFAQKACEEKIYQTDVVFWKKNLRFFSQKTTSV